MMIPVRLTCVLLILMNIQTSSSAGLQGKGHGHDNHASMPQTLIEHEASIKDLKTKVQELEENINELERKHGEDIVKLKNSLETKYAEEINQMERKHDEDIKKLMSEVKHLVACSTKLPVKWRGHCYGLFNMKLSYNQAQSHCKALGANLVWIEDCEEQKFIESTFSPKKVRIWIGCNDKSDEGSFVWIHNNQPVNYTNWHTGEPNNGYDVAENCCEMGYHAIGGWNDYPCEETSDNFICKL